MGPIFHRIKSKVFHVVNGASCHKYEGVSCAAPRTVGLPGFVLVKEPWRSTVYKAEWSQSRFWQKLDLFPFGNREPHSLVFWPVALSLHLLNYSSACVHGEYRGSVYLTPRLMLIDVYGKFLSEAATNLRVSDFSTELPLPQSNGHYGMLYSYPLYRFVSCMSSKKFEFGKICKTFGFENCTFQFRGKRGQIALLSQQRLGGPTGGAGSGLGMITFRRHFVHCFDAILQ